MNSPGYTKQKDKKQKFFLIIRQEDLEFLDGNHCAAALMSVFRNAHKWKVETDARNKRANDIAEQHGDARWLSEDVLISFTVPELSERILYLFGRNAVMAALKFLEEEKKVISTQSNPNKKYKYDQGRYFRFHPEAYNKWLQAAGHNELSDEEERDEELSAENEGSSSNIQAVESLYSLKLNNPPFINKLSDRIPFKNKRPPFKNKPHIDINNNINNKNQSINVSEEIFSNQEEIKPILTALMEKGMPVKRFYPDAIDEIHRLYQSGVTVDFFIKAYDLSVRATQGGEFGVPYLIKVIKDLLNEKHHAKDPPRKRSKDRFSEMIYESDIRNAMKWMKDDSICKQVEEQK